MHATANILAENADIKIRGIHEIEAFDETDVKITNTMPELQHSLPGTLGLEEHDNFRDLTCPTINHDSCDMLIGSDNVNLFEALDEPFSHRVSVSLHDCHSPVGWIISGSVPEMKENYHLTEKEFITEKPWQHEFDEETDDEEIILSNDDRVAMEIVECTIKRVDQFKFQFFEPFRRIHLSMQDNFVQTE